MNTAVQIKTFTSPQDYAFIYQRMREFTQHRDEHTNDELWILEHFPVFTQGQAGKAEHILNPGNIPIVQSDRGGQVTYHGPGQLMIYTLFDLKRLKMGIKTFVQTLQNSIIALLAHYGVKAHTLCHAPGVYVNHAKICSIGLRIRQHRAYHGLALNVNMDLSPFSRINPCGFKQLSMTQISAFNTGITLQQVIADLTPIMLQQFSEHQSLMLGECPL